MKPMFVKYLEGISNDWSRHTAEDGYAWIWNGVPGIWIASYRANRHADAAEPLGGWVLTECNLFSRRGSIYVREWGRGLDSWGVKCCDLSELKLELVKLDLNIPREWSNQLALPKISAVQR